MIELHAEHSTELNKLETRSISVLRSFVLTGLDANVVSSGVIARLESIFWIRLILPQMRFPQFGQVSMGSSVFQPQFAHIQQYGCTVNTVEPNNRSFSQSRYLGLDCRCSSAMRSEWDALDLELVTTTF
jgi:hypothetical protein